MADDNGGGNGADNGGDNGGGSGGDNGGGHGGRQRRRQDFVEASVGATADVAGQRWEKSPGHGHWIYRPVVRAKTIAEDGIVNFVQN